MITLEQKADRVAALMEDRLKIGGKGLAEKLRRGGRRLPRKVRRAADELATMAAQGAHPHIRVTLDDNRATAAYHICMKHLGALGASERMKNRVLGIAASVAFSLLVVGALVLTVLVWRGFL